MSITSGYSRVRDRLRLKSIFNIFVNSTAIVYIMVAIYAAFFSYYTISKHYSFGTYSLDLGVYSQALWSTLHGRVLYETPDLFNIPSRNFLGVHFSPILLLILPLYALYPRPETLLILQSLVLALGALPLYKLAKNELGSHLSSLMLAASYLLYFPLHAANSYDFHVETFLPVLILYSYYFYIEGRYIWSLVFAILSMGVIEVAPIFTAFMGLSMLLSSMLKGESSRSRGDHLLPAMIIFTSIIMFMVGIFISNLYAPTPLARGRIPLLFSGKGESKPIGDVVAGLINPRTLIKEVSRDFHRKLTLWLLMLGPLLFLPLFAPTKFLMVAPWLLPSWLSRYQQFYQIGWQYPAFIIGQLFISLIYALRKIGGKSRCEKGVLMLTLLVLASTASSSVLFSPITNQSIPFKFGFLRGAAYASPEITDSEHIRLLHNVIRMIPSNSSVFTQTEIFPHLSDRFEAYVWLTRDIDIEYILLDVKLPSFKKDWSIWNTTTTQIIQDLLTRREYGVLVNADGILLLKRGYTGPPLIYSPLKLKISVDDLCLGAGKIARDGDSESTYVITYAANESTPVCVCFGPYYTLPPGSYNVTFRIKVEGKAQGKIIRLEVIRHKPDKTLASREIKGEEIIESGWKDFTLEFNTTDLAKNVEFKLFSLRDGFTVTLDHIQVTGRIILGGGRD